MLTLGAQAFLLHGAPLKAILPMLSNGLNGAPPPTRLEASTTMVLVAR